MPAQGSAAPAQTNTLEETFGAPIKQYPGQIQVTRSVKVKAPGKHFNNLRGAEAAADYWATATEYTDRDQLLSGTRRAAHSLTHLLTRQSVIAPSSHTHSSASTVSQSHCRRSSFTHHTPVSHSCACDFD